MKTKAIESLFTGRPLPCEAAVPEEREYREILMECRRREERLLRKLSPEDREELEQIQGRRQEAMQYEIQEAFAQGYSLGVRLTAEAFLLGQTSPE